MKGKEESRQGWKDRLFTVVFEADTPAGKAFDVVLLLLITISVVVVMAESIPAVQLRFERGLKNAEWMLTGLFTVEYILRLCIVGKPLRYATSFYGVIDLLSILPTYLGLLIPDTELLMIVRALRLMRIFRIFKLSPFIREGMAIVLALKASARRILVFLSFVVLLSIVLGTVAYVAESRVNPEFSSIPQSVYWAVVTITTVGYGDVSPVTVIGKFVATVIMLLGYAIIAVPTGIVSVELSRSAKKDSHHTQACPNCSQEAHDPDARYCKSCGHSLRSE